MDNFRDLLLFHFEKYPFMTPVDAVKLCYQSAFGCGHLVKNREMALSMIKTEMEKIKENKDVPLFENIGGGYLRLDLHRAKADGISCESICDIFIKSANCEVKTSFEEKILEVKKLAKEGKTPFEEKKLLEYLSNYGGEMVSHSEQYKNKYYPAYRVVFEKFIEDLQ